MNSKTPMQHLRRLYCGQSEGMQQSLQQIELDLWLQCWQAATQSGSVPFVNLGVTLTQKMAETTLQSRFRYLVEKSVCSFVPSASQEEIEEIFSPKNTGADGEILKSSTVDFRVDPYSSTFAMTYWLSVREMAIVSRTRCMSSFNLSGLIVDQVAMSTPKNVFVACSDARNTALRKFDLSCLAEDCLNILAASSETEENAPQRTALISLLKLKKSNHCASLRVRQAQREAA